MENDRFHKVKANFTLDHRDNSFIEIDGKKVKGVQSVTISQDVNKVPVVIIAFLVAEVSVETEADMIVDYMPVHDPGGVRLKAGTFGADGWPWPFTVSSGKAWRKGSGKAWRKEDALFFDASDGKRYPLNGTARRLHKDFRCEPNINSIWKDNPDIPGTKISLSPVVDRIK